LWFHGDIFNVVQHPQSYPVLSSYPIQDEHEGEVGFQHKINLERMACGGSTIHVHAAEKLKLEQIQAFLNASQAIRFEANPTFPPLRLWL